MAEVKAKHFVDRKKGAFGCPDPDKLCKRMAASIPAELLRNATRILDVGIGCGGISRAIVNRMVNELYIPHYEAILRIYGIDTNLPLVNKMRRLGFINTVCADYATWEPGMKFDVVIGNPPYQGGSFGKAVYKSLWPLFWKKSLELAKDDGYVSLITPLTWCSPTTDLSKRDAIDGKVRLWDVFNSYRSLADVTSVKAFFPGVGSTFSLVNVDKSGSGGLSFTDGYSPSLGFYPLSGPDVVSRELSKSGNIADTLSFKRTDEEWKVSIVSSRTVKEINVEVLEWDQDPVTKLHPSLYGYIYCATREQAEYVRERMLECRDILNKHGRYHGFVCYQILGMISLPKLSFSKTK